MTVEERLETLLVNTEKSLERLDALMRDTGTPIQSKGYAIGVILSAIKSAVTSARAK